MKEFKYVVVQVVGGPEEIYIFPKTVEHAAFAEVLHYITTPTSGGGWHRPFRKEISAGFTNGVSCYGRSETLDLDSRYKVDEALLSNQYQEDTIPIPKNTAQAEAMVRMGLAWLRANHSTHYFVKEGVVE